jgi:hypothetical protein
VVARAAAKVKGAGRRIKAQADRGQGAVLQHLQARARPPAVRGNLGCLAWEQAGPNRGEGHGRSFARWRGVVPRLPAAQRARAGSLGRDAPGARSGPATK